MSKRLPYYQSEPAEYLAGDIMFCSYAAQGVFTIIRALYWQRDCEMSLNQLKRRLKDADELIQELIDENIIKVKNGNISINFLDEQYEKLLGINHKNSIAGKKSAELKKIRKEINNRLKFISENTNENLEALQHKFNINSTDVKFLLQQNSTIKIKEDKIRRDKEDKREREQEKPTKNLTALQILKQEKQSELDILWMQNKSQIPDEKKLIENFNNKMDLELAQRKIEFEPEQLMPRFKAYVLNWISNENDSKKAESLKQQPPVNRPNYF